MEAAARTPWRLDLGARVLPEGTHFRVWAPKARQVEVEISTRRGSVLHLLTSESDGMYGGIVPRVRAGARYRFRLDGKASYPDPCSRSQPDGPHGSSEVVDPDAFPWTDGAWPGLRADGLVIYECHVGIFTPAGTFASLARQLHELRCLGITAIELMPIAEFPGRWNWGYDAVDANAAATDWTASGAMTSTTSRTSS